MRKSNYDSDVDFSYIHTCKIIFLDRIHDKSKSALPRMMLSNPAKTMLQGHVDGSILNSLFISCLRNFPWVSVFHGEKNRVSMSIIHHVAIV